MTRNATYMLLMGWMLSMAPLAAQEEGIRWMTFEQLEDSLARTPKRVFIDFYADWCVYCKKMDRVAFRDSGVIARLNRDYYAVRMNAESSDTIIFEGRVYVNPDFGKKRRPVHEIARMLASRDGRPFTLPAVVILDESFRVRKRYFEYIPPKRMRELLRE